MLKIIAGKGRGRVLATLPKNYPVRPILARIKKSLFDILMPRLPGSRFLDLYAGTGAVGLEALSRGAQHVCFVEKDRRCLDLIKKNAEILGFSSAAGFFQQDVLADVSHLPRPFDLVFMGPPYVDMEKKPLALVAPTLDNVARHQLVPPTGLVIAQHHKKEQVSVLPPGWTMTRQEIYGDTSVSFFRPPQIT